MTENFREDNREHVYTMAELRGLLGFTLSSDFIESLGVEIVEVGPARCVRIKDAQRLFRTLAWRILSTSEMLPA